jgi:hypothetical protein
MSLSEVRGGRGIKDRQISSTAGIRQHKLAQNDRFFYYDGKGRWNGCQSDGTVASEVDQEINYLTDGRGNCWEKLNINTQVSGYPFPAPGTTGTNLAIGNQTSAQGAEFVPGGNHAMSPCAFTVGTHEFFMKYTVKVEDVGGVDLWCGFHKVATLVAIPTSYDDYAAILYDGTALTAASTTKTQYDVDNAGPTTTDMSLAIADAATLSGEIKVDLGGRVTFLFNGASNSLAPSITLVAGDVFVPFIAYINTADVVGYIDLQELTVGLSDANVR